LRREAEALIIPNLAALLHGEYQPQENSERLNLIGHCRFRQAFRAVVRLAADAFAADPPLADDGQAFHRYNAACAAARASSCQGTDSAELDDVECSHLRRQSLAWLRADLDGCVKRLEGATALERAGTRRRLEHWRRDDDLSGVRGLSAIARLPEQEQTEWRSLWSDMDAVLQKIDIGQ
jgi:serine/threonine-protein kinase